MKNYEVYEKDPRTHTLLNQGVAKVASGQTSAELKTLRYELENFVCEGQYAEGLTRILSTYLGHLDKTEQPGVWVSGFFGSGKSHLVKMLQSLWTDFEFPDGARARGVKELPTGIKELLTELSTAAKRLGGLRAIAGSLGGGGSGSVRLDLLRVVFQSVGLPGDYRTASFVLWLREEWLEEPILSVLRGSGADVESALANFYISDRIAKTILDQRPGSYNTVGDVKLLLESQFPEKADISIDEMIAKVKQAVGKKGKLPCVLIILDEVQQYIGEDLGRTKAVQDLQENLCSRLGTSVMFVGTGQNALSGTPQLQKLMGRFPVKVELEDVDAERVTREVVLKKKPSAMPILKTLLDEAGGEIERQLRKTKLSITARDRGLLIQDYGILPVRRRFWEKVLRAVDTTGTGAQLRSQLWIVHEAALRTAELPIGHVISGAFLFEHVLSGVLKSGVLVQEIADTIARQKRPKDKSDLEGEFRYQLCALIFLIGQLSCQGPSDIGVRADDETLSDLLVTDLTRSSVELRKRVPEVLIELAEAGAIMPLDDEYRMQTREGSEWTQWFQRAKDSLLADTGRLGGIRADLLKVQCGEVFKKVKLTHGSSKVARKIEPHYGSESPDGDGVTVPVWIRDGWEFEERAVVNDVRVAGESAAVVYGFIPRSRADDLKQAIATLQAATDTLQARGTSSEAEAIEARKAMQTREEQARQTLQRLLDEILDSTIVHVAGGDLVEGSTLAEKVQEAANSCLVRLFPSFHQADKPAKDWEKVGKQAREGHGDAMTAVGHAGPPEDHPVCKAVLSYVGSGKKGTEVRKQFGGRSYGWPQDAIDAALSMLHLTGALQARSGNGPIAKKKLGVAAIATAEFRAETIIITTVQLIAIRGVFQKAGLNNVQNGQESAAVPKFVSDLTALAQAAGGDAPLPRRDDISLLADIANRVGNGQLLAIYDQRDRLTREIAGWQERGQKVLRRLPHWNQLTSLLGHVADLPIADEVRPEVAAIGQDRGLLNDPDPVPGLVEKLASALRLALNQAQAACSMAFDAGHSSLDASATWQKLTPEQRHKLLSDSGARLVPAIMVGTTEEILETLGKTRLSEMWEISLALPTKFSNALAAAARLLEPKAQPVSLKTATIKTEDDLKSWLTDSGQRIREKMKTGPVIL
jgi:hypothetical protein